MSADEHLKICQELNDIYYKKNQDYGDSFSKQFEEYGITSSAIRLDDKMSRFKNLIKNEAQVNDESIEDTLIDLANYAIMTVMELRSPDPSDTANNIDGILESYRIEVSK